MHLPRALIVALLVVSSLALARADAPSPDYRLVWADEFDGETLDRKKWDYRQLGKRRDAINVKDTVRLDGKGHLVLEVGKWAGDIRKAKLPDAVSIDWVRVYKKKPQGEAAPPADG